MRKPLRAQDKAGDGYSATQLLAERLSEVSECGDPAAIGPALGVAIRQYGISRAARESGVSREHLHRLINGTSSPSFQTVHQVLLALGFTIEIKPASDGPAHCPTRRVKGNGQGVLGPLAGSPPVSRDDLASSAACGHPGCSFANAKEP